MSTPRGPGVKVVNFGVEAKPGPNQGGLVQRVARFSSAAKGGIIPGDEILAFDGKRMTAPEQVQAALAAAGVGATIQVTLLRNGSPMELPVLLLEKKTLKLDLDEVDEVLERKIAP